MRRFPGRCILHVMKTFPSVRPSFLFVAFGLVPMLSGCGDEMPKQNAPPTFPAVLQADLQATLDDVVAKGAAPGTALYVSAPEGSWSGVAGLADIKGNVAMTPNARFRSGSRLKTLVATAVLQSMEKGLLDVKDVLTKHLPVEATAKIQNADLITVEMLLRHRTGIPEWITPAVRQKVVMDPAYVWSFSEILGIVEAQQPAFKPGESYAYSNTNYVILGEILSAVEGRSWREVIRERVIAVAGMVDTTLPDSGDIECPGCAHGYVPMGADMLDTTKADPSMAGACGGHALISTNADMTHFLEKLRAGTFFEKPETLAMMFDLQPAVDAQTHQTAYGFGMMQLESEGDVVIGHLGTTAGYAGFSLYVPATNRYFSGYLNVYGDPSAVLVPVVARLAQP